MTLSSRGDGLSLDELTKVAAQVRVDPAGLDRLGHP
ncbi:hypothetical protein ACWT_3024 [Actinoplanes sp. SE50]|nr:hypothetical protein ACPL_3152 [Actinoplanes sp. SE50/110]ATO82439.1 hypothetical protein ACWT_3024 [Actinoplanes sp. SE50]SLL99846.1 hypothetical protein ACSP50_3078 [Actinoplanes sp. SE50/110]